MTLSTNVVLMLIHNVQTQEGQPTQRKGRWRKTYPQLFHHHISPLVLSGTSLPFKGNVLKSYIFIYNSPYYLVIYFFRFHNADLIISSAFGCSFSEHTLLFMSEYTN